MLICPVLQVLKGAAEKYADFVGSGVSEGVTEAFTFHKRLWLAKHPGQPLPRGEVVKLWGACTKRIVLQQLHTEALVSAACRCLHTC